VAVTCIPILPSRDLRATADWYAPLGFAVGGLWPDEYLILTHPRGIELHFWPHPDEVPETNDVACYVRCDTLDEVHAIHDEWADVVTARTGIPRLTPVGTTGPMLETALIDPDGTLVRIGTPAPT
jgi:hypothetical protein